MQTSDSVAPSSPDTCFKPAARAPSDHSTSVTRRYRSGHRRSYGRLMSPLRRAHVPRMRSGISVVGRNNPSGTLE